LVAIAARGLTASYGGRAVLDRIDFDVASASILAVLGPNGSGKSTLVRAIAGLAPCNGHIEFEAGRDPTHGSKPRIGYMPQDFSARVALTVFEVVLLGRLSYLALRVEPEDLETARSVLLELGIADLADRYLSELSGGQRQLVYLAQVLASDPHILLLDEPTSALDMRNQLEVLDLVRTFTRRRGLTTVIVIHDLNAAARFADRVIALKDGRVHVAGPPSEAITAGMLAEVFGIEAIVEPGYDRLPTVIPIRPLSNMVRAA
jgi:iron complex transport system ATP-binding protein